jgi:UDPglucose--hexose-1-phosphate uridylyltransferase
MDLNMLAPHRRFNPLIGEWVLVSPHRTQRPWQGQVEDTAAETALQHDESCYLCPGNPRAGGQQTPAYTGTYVFDNDYPALLPDTAEGALDDQGLLVAASERGRCRVVCFSPRHDLTLATMQPAEIRRVIDTWTDEYRTLGSDPGIGYVQIFENRGAMMGASNPHPHGQIWATQHVPNESFKEGREQLAWSQAKGTCMLCEYARLEMEKGERVACYNDHFLAVVPFWAVWPYELLVLPRGHHSCLESLGQEERDGFADLLQRVTSGYNRVFETSFPYSMGIHQRPTDGRPHEHWHMHAHFYPPLLRSATVRKFMVGFEMLGGPQRDITPESAAERLRECMA